MTSVIELINLIRPRPELYLGQKSISILRVFIDGWMFNNEEKLKDDEFMNEFQRWIEKRLYRRTNQSWCNIILFFSLNHEAEALANFFEYFDEWLTDRNNKQAEATTNEFLINIDVETDEVANILQLTMLHNLGMESQEAIVFAFPLN